MAGLDASRHPDSKSHLCLDSAFRELVPQPDLANQRIRLRMPN
jgi:hypothetical protein